MCMGSSAVRAKWDHGHPWVQQQAITSSKSLQLCAYATNVGQPDRRNTDVLVPQCLESAATLHEHSWDEPIRTGSKVLRPTQHTIDWYTLCIHDTVILDKEHRSVQRGNRASLLDGAWHRARRRQILLQSSASARPLLMTACVRGRCRQLLKPGLVAHFPCNKAYVVGTLLRRDPVGRGE